jgi:hypothetical protein
MADLLEVGRCLDSPDGEINLLYETRERIARGLNQQLRCNITSSSRLNGNLPSLALYGAHRLPHLFVQIPLHVMRRRDIAGLTPKTNSLRHDAAKYIPKCGSYKEKL